MTELFANDFESVLVSTGTGTITVTNAAGLPTPTGGDLVRLRISPAIPDGSYEIVNMTGRAGNVLTVARAQELTTQIAWAAGAKVSAVPTALSLQTLQVVVATVQYAGSLAAARPPLAGKVFWEGFPSAPTNMVDGDVWFDPAGGIYDRAAALGPAGCIRASHDRTATPMGQAIQLVSGTLYLQAFECFAGDLCTSLNVRAGTGGWTGITHCWGVIADANRLVLARTNDDTAAAPTVLTVEALSFTSPYAIPTTGLYYVGLMVAASVATVPVVGPNNSSAAQQSLPPITSGTSNTAQTTRPNIGDTLTALTAAANVSPFLWIT